MKLLLALSLLLVTPACADTIFTPYDNGAAESRTCSLVTSAAKSIKMSAYALTDMALATELIAAAKRGVDVQILADKSQSKHNYEKTLLTNLKSGGVKVLIGTSPVHGQLLHCKFLSVDSIHTEIGSWNFTGATASAQFNSLTFSDDPSEAAVLEAAWQKIHDSILERATK